MKTSRTEIFMPAETISIPVPHALYERLERLALLSGRSLESLVAQTLATSLPLIPENLPSVSREALRSLEQRPDAELWSILQQTATDAQIEQFGILREQQRHGALLPDDAAQLEGLRAALDLMTLEKAYAAVILKWRGHRIPTLAELAA
jgi:hypothetical protein